MAITAEWHVHVLATNHGLAVLACSAEGETRVLLAKLADGCELLYLFTFG